MRPFVIKLFKKKNHLSLQKIILKCFISVCYDIKIKKENHLSLQKFILKCIVSVCYNIKKNIESTKIKIQKELQMKSY